MAVAAVQWTINQLWDGLARLRDGFNSVAADLKSNQAELTRLWSATKADTNAARRAANQKLLQPLIHQNSVLRLSYLAPIRDKYNEAVKLAADALKRAGYTTPGGLSGLGVVVAFAPLAAATLVVAALAILTTVTIATQAQRTNTASVARVIGNANLTPQQQQDLLDTINRTNRSLPPPPGLDFGWVPWAIGGVLAIMVVPKILPARNTA